MGLSPPSALQCWPGRFVEVLCEGTSSSTFPPFSKWCWHIFLCMAQEEQYLSLVTHRCTKKTVRDLIWLTWLKMKVCCSVTLFGVRRFERTFNRKYTASCVHVHTQTHKRVSQNENRSCVDSHVCTHTWHGVQPFPSPLNIDISLQRGTDVHVTRKRKKIVLRSSDADTCTWCPLTRTSPRQMVNGD